MSNEIEPSNEDFTDLILRVYQNHYGDLKRRKQKLVIKRPLPLRTFFLFLREGISVQINEGGMLPMVSLAAVSR